MENVDLRWGGVRADSTGEFISELIFLMIIRIRISTATAIIQTFQSSSTLPISPHLIIMLALFRPNLDLIWAQLANPFVRFVR